MSFSTASLVNGVRQKDNLEYLQEIPNKSIDLIYCDILYGTGRNFSDFQDLKPKRDVIEAHYIPRLTEMRRVLKDTGSIYLQMDTRINHWMRCIMDDIFGYKNFQNELVWCYRTQGFSKKKYSEKHDVILFYSKGGRFTFNLEDVREEEIGAETLKRYGKEIELYGKTPSKKNGKIYWSSPYSPLRDWFLNNSLPQAHPERVGYDTQKPKSILERIIKASSNPGDLVADFYCGSGTTLVVAKELGRRYIGCNINEKAVQLTRKRLAETST